MSNARVVLFNYGSTDLKTAAALVAQLKQLGFEVLETRSSKVALKLLETRKDIGFVLTDEEGLDISGTGVTQRFERMGINPPSAVLSTKQIPPGRVPVFFRRPIDVTKLAQYVSEKFSVSASPVVQKPKQAA